MIDSFFTRFRPTTENSDCAALGEDPEWNELVAWAGVEVGARSGSSAGARDEGSNDAEPNTAAGEIGPDESEDWEQVIAQAKANTPAPVPLPRDDIFTRRARETGAPAAESEDWDRVIAQAKANTPAPLARDDISTRRARAAGLARQPRTDHGLDSWDLALLRAKRR